MAKPIPYLPGLPPECMEPLQSEPLREDMTPPNLDDPVFWQGFLMRTRRYHQLTRGPKRETMAKGLDTDLSGLA
jgi:hypothetical protein